jgi:hypothetical protein
MPLGEFFRGSQGWLTMGAGGVFKAVSGRVRLVTGLISLINRISYFIEQFANLFVFHFSTAALV